MIDTRAIKQKIIELAITGKLIKQEFNGNDASFIVEEIRKEKKDLIEKGIIKGKPDFSYIYKGSDNCYYEKINNKDSVVIKNLDQIPSNWAYSRMKYVLDVRDGTHDSPKYCNNGVPFVTSKCLKNGKIDFSICKEISLNDANKINERSKVDYGDILFAMIGTIGNPTIVYTDKTFAIKNVALFKNINRSLLLEKWVKYVLEYYTNKMKADTSSGLQPFVSLDFLRNYIIPIPPTCEQLKIVKKLDYITEIIDNIECDKDYIENSLETLKKKILIKVFENRDCDNLYYENLKEISNFYKLISIVNKEIKIKDVMKKGLYPVVSQSKNNIDGYSDDEDKLIEDIPVIIFGDHTKIVKYVDYPFIPGADGTKVLKPKNIDPKYLYYCSLYASNKIDNRGYGRHYSMFKSVAIPCPNIEKQKKIVEQLNNILCILETIE